MQGGQAVAVATVGRDRRISTMTWRRRRAPWRPASRSVEMGQGQAPTRATSAMARSRCPSSRRVTWRPARSALALTCWLALSSGAVPVEASIGERSGIIAEPAKPRINICRTGKEFGNNASLYPRATNIFPLTSKVESTAYSLGHLAACADLLCRRAGNTAGEGR